MVLGKVITFSLQKGGVGKTTTCALTAFLLSQMDYKVLTVDMDSQGNLTQIISGYDDLTVFKDQTVKNAMELSDADSFIKVINDNLHYLPADDYLVLMSEEVGPLGLRNALANTIDDYDFILVDTPPNLGKETLNALFASDYVVMMFETAKSAYNALPRFIGTVEGVKANGNSSLEIVGILATLADSRRSDSKELLELVKEEYNGLVFNTVISRRAAVGRIAVYGLNENPEIRKATEQHREFVKELLERVTKG